LGSVDSGADAAKGHGSRSLQWPTRYPVTAFTCFLVAQGVLQLIITAISTSILQTVQKFAVSKTLMFFVVE